MKLSDKLKQLQQEAQEDELTIDAIEDGFNRCIEDAEYLESNLDEVRRHKMNLQKEAQELRKKYEKPAIVPDYKQGGSGTIQ